jgi:MoaA/NifB/PqqE/SkfB family radical SAM enzyme
MSRLLKHLKYPIRYPGIIGRVASNYLRMAIGQKRLRGIEFALTYKCDCNCAHCSAELMKSDGRPMLSTEQIASVLDQAWKLGTLSINLTGGEALLRPDLERIARSAHPKSTVVSVATNGASLDAGRARSLAEAGVRIVTISIDSADPETHDNSRGRPGSFDEVMTATENCEQAGIEVFWCTIMTPENVANHDLLDMVDLAGGRKLTLTINLPCSVGGWREMKLALPEADRELHRKLMKLPHVRWEGHSNYREEGCPAGIEKLYISPFGDVMPCPFIHITYGNLFDKSLTEIWREMLDAGTFDRIRPGCPIADDPKFNERVIVPVNEQDRHPLPHTEHPNLGSKR